MCIRDSHKDTLKMLVEVSEKRDSFEDVIKEEIKAELKLRAEVEIVSKNKIPNDGLVIEDTRTYE